MKLYVTWIFYVGAYRVYDPKDEAQTIAYVDRVDEAIAWGQENGYDEVKEV